MNGAVLWQRLEGFVIFALGVFLCWQWHAMPWWEALLIFFAPDLSFSGYLLGPKIGAFVYNTVHVYAFGVIFLVIGIWLDHPFCASIGALWLAHSGFDRMFGYGLKLSEGFSFTHLGRIGKDGARQD